MGSEVVFHWVISGKETLTPAQIQWELGDVVQKDGQPCSLFLPSDGHLYPLWHVSLHDLVPSPQYSLGPGRALYPPIALEKSGDLRRKMPCSWPHRNSDNSALKLCASTAGRVGLIPGWGTNIPYALGPQKERKKEKREKTWQCQV